MFTDTLIKLFKRDLSKLKEEINGYKVESNLWLTPGEIKNSAGNLGLHLVGNLNHFIGAALGNTGYIRQRDLEFSLKDVPRIELIKQIDDTMVIVENTLSKLTPQDLEQQYKHRVFEKPTSTEYFLVHLAMHLAYHLGQINYHRRLIEV
ncbi:DinB family protein [Winogradskyella sp.]|uniref:DinB family protein n=1 Tax=Winogradskyella sp. TaxID=1883156 RepID=UPI001B22AE6A|nr:DinB family protein [Winogradskyella sp.]MBO6881752.1 DinB family protein [Winogradskyella sp.]